MWVPKYNQTSTSLLARKSTSIPLSIKPVVLRLKEPSDWSTVNSKSNPRLPLLMCFPASLTFFLTPSVLSKGVNPEGLISFV